MCNEILYIHKMSMNVILHAHTAVCKPGFPHKLYHRQKISRAPIFKDFART